MDVYMRYGFGKPSLLDRINPRSANIITSNYIELLNRFIPESIEFQDTETYLCVGRGRPIRGIQTSTYKTDDLEEAIRTAVRTSDLAASITICVNGLKKEEYSSDLPDNVKVIFY